MPFTATYDATLSRVRLVASGAAVLPAATASVVIDRFDTAVLTNPDPVRGGALAAATGDTVRVDDREFTPGVLSTYRIRAYNGVGTLLTTTTATATPNPAQVWLRSPTRPFLDRPVSVFEYGDVTTAGRGGVFEVLGRRQPIAVTEVRGSKRFDLTLLASTTAELDALELFLSFGDTILLQPPAGSAVPGPMYVSVGQVVRTKGGRHQLQRRYLILALTEVAAPDASIAGATITWAGVVSAYATWAAVAGAKTTWLDLMTSISAPADEVVG